MPVTHITSTILAAVTHCRAKRPRLRVLHAAACVSLVFAAALATAQCKQGDPAGQFEGSAVSSQAGKLDISLSLQCNQAVYAGILNTPIGAYAVTSGSFQGKRLTLVLSLNGNRIALEAIAEGPVLNGTFSSADDKGPFELHRVGDVVAVQTLTDLTPAQWREDLHFFAAQLPKRHPDAFANTPKPAFDAAVADLDANIDRMNADEIYVGLDRLANLIGDGHTYVKLPTQDANLPLDIARFDDDARIEMVGPGYEQALGLRIVAIDGVPLAHARELAATLTPVAETTGLKDLRVDAYLSIGMMLHGLGITPKRGTARYLLDADDGRQITVEFKALAEGQEPEWIHADSPLPLAEQPVKGSAACTMLRSAATLYCNVRMILQLKEPSLQMLELIRREHPEKVAIDLRQNGGGDYNLGLKYLIRPLMQNKIINRKGHLFVLIGPNTFSAAMSNAAQFRTMTNAVLVGQTIGERPNSYQEPREFTLPNSRLIVRYSTRFYKFTDSPVNVVAPDKEISVTWSEFREGHDPALDWILQQK